MSENCFELLRHGETVSGGGFRGRIDDELTATGWSSMQQAVGDSCRWQCIVSSPLKRCADFAHYLAAKHDLPLCLDERLREMDFGLWEGHSAESLMRSDPVNLQLFWQDPIAHTPPQAEPVLALQARVLSAWHALNATGTACSTLLVTHAGPIRVLLAHLSGLSADRLLSFDVPHASLYRIACGYSDDTPTAIERIHPR